MRWHDKQAALVCAQDAYHKKFYADLSREEFDRRMAAKLAAAWLDILKEEEILRTLQDLHELGCSDLLGKASVFEIFRAEPPEEFSWNWTLWSNYALWLAISLAISVAVYGLVRPWEGSTMNDDGFGVAIVYLSVGANVIAFEGA